MYSRSILTRNGLRDLLVAHIAVEEGLVSGHVAAELCLSSFLRDRGSPSSVPELIAEAGQFSAERLHWLQSEADRQIKAYAAERRVADASHGLPRADLVHAGEDEERAMTLRPMPEDRYGRFQLIAEGGGGVVLETFPGEGRFENVVRSGHGHSSPRILRESRPSDDT